MEAIDIINDLRVKSHRDIKFPKNEEHALSWQILYQVTCYLEDPACLVQVRRLIGNYKGKSLAMNSRRIARYLKHYDKSGN